MRFKCDWFAGVLYNSKCVSSSCVPLVTFTVDSHVLKCAVYVYPFVHSLLKGGIQELLLRAC